MIENGSHLVLFPTVASEDPHRQVWTAEVHGWCFDSNEDLHFQRATAGLLRRSLKLPRYGPDPPFFRERAHGFVVDNRKKMAIEISGSTPEPLTLITKRNGHYRGVVPLDMSHPGLQPLLTAHGSPKTRLSARRIDLDISAMGEVHLLSRQGLSIISDIDDTIKFSNVCNKRELLANTFLRSFRCIEGMPELFQRLARPEVCFHYISATPWQMYYSISRFFVEQGFPEGSIHLRKFALKDATILKKLFPAHKKKRNVIESLLLRFPERRFLLFGDTGERDPEMYGEIARKFPKQIIGICVRNVSPDAPDSLRFRRAFLQIPTDRWFVFEDSLRLEEKFLPWLQEQHPQLVGESPL